MKKTLKTVIPILLVLVLLAVGYWFFFRARADVTAGLLLDLAESQAESGHYSMAIRCYRWANSLNPQDAEIALRLAEVYRQSGNYSKTESTLVHAIYDAPSDVRLYEALSRVFVDQDKLLDAQQLLDEVSNPEARAALEAKRPAAPTVNPEAGSYSDYITVELGGIEEGTVCCATLDGSYPSLTGDVYEGAFSLPAGDTTVRAVIVGENGLVSPALYAEYRVAGVVEDVEFHDEALLAATQELLHRSGRTLRTDELWGIESFTLPEGLTDTTDLQHYTGMNKLVGAGLGELDYGFLSAMPELRYLELENCVVSMENLQQIAACEQLEVLILADCGISNVEPLRRLSSLRILDLSDNSVSSISALTALRALDELYLGHNALTSLPILRGMDTLRILDLSYNALDYVGGISACPAIERLNLSHNRLKTVTSLSALTNLVWLNASNNAVSDSAPLAPCTKLESLLMSNNKLTDVDFLQGCPNIREVNIDYNDVTSVPAFQLECPLESFSAAHNFLENLSGLGGLKSLAYVNADYNNIRDINILTTCPALTQVNVYGTYIRSGGPLAENGVVVNFTPGF
ncbi:MAG: leucine-rich repeat domain-containing protein [Oscillospiraceae bacterium]|nr:leucine-rich repeat domain-containing protein [Oscillospiraceae bacterium]